MKWLQEGEKVSRCFCNLESRHFKKKKNRSFLKRVNGEIISDQELVLEEVTQCYEDLYRHRETADVDLRYNLADILRHYQMRTVSLLKAL